MVASAVLGALAAVFGIPLRQPLAPEMMRHDEGHGYIAILEPAWPWAAASDSSQNPEVSTALLFEEGQRLGPPHTPHASIRRVGKGRFSHWQGRLYFSASDNSDPRKNGREYHAVLRVRPALGLSLLIGAIVLAAGVARGVWHLRSGRIGKADILVPLALASGVVLVFSVTSRSSGVALWLLLGIDAVLLIWALAILGRSRARNGGRAWKGLARAQNLSLSAVSLTLALAVSEGSIQAVTALRRETVRPVSANRIQASLEPALASFGVKVPPQVLEAAVARGAAATLPEEVSRSAVEVEGAAFAYRWHDVVHVYDQNGMRRTEPFPPRRSDVFRVMVVGDSLTYGDGIDETWTYPRQLEALLEPDYEVEVLNLGVDGFQSEDVAIVAGEFLRSLQPDLVVYGVCLNDFLPSGAGQYASNFAYEVPLPAAVKSFFTDRSRLARLIEGSYDRMLLALGVRNDFFDDILEDFKGYQRRFASDVAGLNRMVMSRGLPPLVALVLDQYPGLDARGRQIARAAERHLEAAGADVVDTSGYYDHFDGQNFRVSRVEGHPNEIANAIWAVMLSRHLRDLPELSEFRRAGTPGDEDLVR